MSTGALDPMITVALTCDGRAALDRYTAVLRQLPRMARDDHQAPAPCLRVADADRDAVVAALGEHFAHGRLTLDELKARLAATLTATTHGQLSPGGLGLAGPDDAPAPGQPSPTEAGNTRAQARPSSRPRSMAAPSRLDPRRVIMSQDGKRKERTRVKRDKLSLTPYGDNVTLSIWRR